MGWDFSDGRPIWQQIAERITRDAVTGRYAPGERIPSVRELAEEAAVNPNTMQRALAELEREGILASARTAGRFVTEDASVLASARERMAFACAERFLGEMRALGYTTDEALRLAEQKEKGGSPNA